MYAFVEKDPEKNSLLVKFKEEHGYDCQVFQYMLNAFRNENFKISWHPFYRYRNRSNTNK